MSILSTYDYCNICIFNMQCDNDVCVTDMFSGDDVCILNIINHNDMYIFNSSIRSIILNIINNTKRY